MNNNLVTFDDVLIKPVYSEVRSRKLVDTTTNLTKNVRIASPIVSSPMSTVTKGKMAKTLAIFGGAGIIHRFMSIDEQLAELDWVKSYDESYIVGAAVGVKGDYFERASQCVRYGGADFLCIDIASGHNIVMAEALEKLSGLGVDIIAGSVATAEGAEFLIEHGAGAVRLGVGPGSACSTRIVAGVGVPQLSAILDAAQACDEAGIPLIADGGIRYPGDVAKAIAAGASSVMLGSLLAATAESPGSLIERDGRLYKVYYGMASSKAMATIQDLNDTQQNEDYTAPEGIETTIPYSGPAIDSLNYLASGLKSAMSYSNSLTIPEFHSRAELITISGASLTESHPHAMLLG